MFPPRVSSTYPEVYYSTYDTDSILSRPINVETRHGPYYVAPQDRDGIPLKTWKKMDAYEDVEGGRRDRQKPDFRWAGYRQGQEMRRILMGCFVVLCILVLFGCLGYMVFEPIFSYTAPSKVSDSARPKGLISQGQYREDILGGGV